MNKNHERSADRVRGFGIPRWLIIVAAALALIVVAGTVALKVLFPPEKLRAMIVPRIEEKVGSEVTLSDVRLRVFPRIAVRLDDFAIANPPGYSAEPALRLDALELQVALWPLLRKQVELGRVRLLGPEIRYEVLADGTSNLSLLGPPEDTAVAGAGEAEGAPAAPAAAGAFVVSDLALSDGTVYYADARSGRVARLDLEARLEAERVAGNERAMAGRGTIALSSIRTLVGGAATDTLVLPDLEIEYAMLLDLPGDSLALDEVELAMGEVTAQGGGVVRGLLGERSVDMNLETGEVDVAAFLASLPAEMRPQEVAAAGRSRLSLAVQGPVGDGAKPQVNGTLQLEDVSASYGEYGGVLSGGSGELRFDLESLSLPSFSGDLLGEPFELGLTVSDFETRQLDGQLSGEVDLERLAGLREGAAPMQGVARFDIGFSGPAQQPERLRLRGPIELRGVSYQSESLAVPARIASATIRLTGSGVAADAIPVRLGESDLNISFDGPELLSYALSRGAADATPHIRFAVTSQRLDLSELTVPDTTQPGYSDLLTARLAGRQLGGRDPGELARERYAETPVIPPVNADGRVRIAELLNPPTRAQNISFDVVVRDSVLRVRELAGDLYGGRVSGGLTLDLSGGQPPFGLDYDLRLSGGQAGDFVQRWTRLGRAMNGIVDFNVSGSTTIDEGFLPAPDAIDAAGRASFTQGRFQDFGLVNALAGQLKLDAGRLSGFSELGGPFEIEGGNFLVRDWSFAGTDLKGAVAGTAGLGGTLDLQLDLELPMETLERAGLIESGGGLLGNLLGQLAGGDDAIQIAVGIGGTMSSPALQLDRDALREELQRRFGAAGRSLLQKLLEPPPR
jgi:hypothetical protein